MMKKITIATFLVLVAISSGAQQTTAPKESTNAAPNTDCLLGTIKSLKTALTDPNSDDTTKKARIAQIITRWPVHFCYLDTDGTLRQRLLGKAEAKRLDKQPGATNTAAGTTSLLDKGSAPWLLGFSLEHGGLTQDVDGNTITFRGNVVNSIRALLDSTYLGSYQLGDDDPLVTYLAKLSFGVSFDTSTQANTSQNFTFDRNSFSGATAKYEIYNHRDPRDKKWAAKWDALSVPADQVAGSFGGLTKAIETDSNYTTWRDTNVAAIFALPPDAPDTQLQAALQTAITSGDSSFGNLPAVKAAANKYKAALGEYLTAEDAVFAKIKRSPIITLDYSFVRQSLPAAPAVTAAPPAQSLPDLSNITLVLERGFGGANAPELTFNASSTFFHGSLMSGVGRVRDYRASLQLDVPLREIQNIGQPTLSFAGQYLHLLEEPLGQQVTVNGVTITRTGGIGVFQTKLSIPVKDSGVKIPISFTYANRTELIKETDVRGNVGVTFDFDSLFAKAK